MYKFEDAGLRNVWLANGYTVKKTRYGEAVAIENVAGLTRAICLALTKKPGRLSGAEFRYLRLNMDMSQKSLAKMFGNTEQAVAIWEKKGSVPLWADKWIRLLWQARNDGNEPIKRVIERQNVVERLIESKIVLEETRRGWKSKVEEVS